MKTPLGAPTGQVAVPSGNGFEISKGGVSGESAFIFATESGAIEGWNPSVDLDKAVMAFRSNDDRRGGKEDGAHFTGLAYDPASNQLFATDLVGNAVDVFDNTFTKIASFTDLNLPKGYAPFNVAVLNGQLYVAYGLRKGDDVKEGAGLGYVDVFTTSGTLVKTLVANGPLNAPWGLAIAPSTFGSFAGNLLVGNFGDGRINVFDPNSGSLLGTLSDSQGHALHIEGLWALDDTGNGSITFTAGLRKEKHGLLGQISAQ